MRYMCLIYTPHSDSVPDEAEIKATMDAYGAFTTEAIESQAMLAGDALHPVDTATTVRVRDGQTLTTDGPFAETAEWLAGFYVFECPDLDAAIAWAAKIPGAREGSVEVRPLVELDL